jgi:hypothetical protein
MKIRKVLGFMAGLAAGAAVAVVGKKAVTKISEEIKADVNEQNFVSPEGNHFVAVSFGVSETAKGLAVVKVKATAADKDDDCKLTALARQGAEFINGEWLDNDHFALTIGAGKRKQCCDVDFDGDEIVAQYYLMKN